ncbi:restriction endonuclease [Uliginosibacterium paludis]|uniref:Restriction endonuclease n=1 Tax=Uliginosibacterium paludis TaxID=1615952 RepID=A0ABV2CTA8_9RHOO
MVRIAGNRRHSEGRFTGVLVGACSLSLCAGSVALALRFGGQLMSVPARYPLWQMLLPVFNLLWAGLALFLGGMALRKILRRNRAGIPAIREADSDPASERAFAARRAQQDETTGFDPLAEPAEWSLDLLHELDWKRFEDLCVAYYRARDINAYSTPIGAEGGVDIRLYQDEFDAERCTAIVLCKAWGERFVGVGPIRELRELMTRERIGKAFFMAPGKFSHEACDFAAESGITLIDGTLFLSMLRRLPADVSDRLLYNICQGDWRTPSCPVCGVKMKSRLGDRGLFWACPNFPDCRQMLGMRPSRIVA